MKGKYGVVINYWNGAPLSGLATLPQRNWGRYTKRFASELLKWRPETIRLYAFAHFPETLLLRRVISCHPAHHPAVTPLKHQETFLTSGAETAH